MIRYAKLTLSEPQLAALHYLAIDLARARGLRRLPVGQLRQEAVTDLLEKHGMTVNPRQAVSDIEAQDV